LSDRRRVAGGGIPTAPAVRERFQGEKGYGCSAQGPSVANYGGLHKTYLVGDWCSSSLLGVAWDGGANKWQMQEFMQTQLQFTAGNCRCRRLRARDQLLLLLHRRQGPNANPVGALWRIAPADK
jgi:hypothetical protein